MRRIHITEFTCLDEASQLEIVRNARFQRQRPEPIARSEVKRVTKKAADLSEKAAKTRSPAKNKELAAKKLLANMSPEAIARLKSQLGV